MLKQSTKTFVDPDTGEVKPIDRESMTPKQWNSLPAKDRFPYGLMSEKPDLTVPDQSMPLAELLNRHVHGIGVDGQRIGLFEEDPNKTDGINPHTLDLVDIQRLRLMKKEEIENLKQRAKDEIQARRQRELDAIKEQQDREAERIAEAVKKAQNGN